MDKQEIIKKTKKNVRNIYLGVVGVVKTKKYIY